jgi:hypothetical protein
MGRGKVAKGIDKATPMAKAVSGVQRLHGKNTPRKEYSTERIIRGDAISDQEIPKAQAVSG